MVNESEASQTIEKLRTRYEGLNNEKIKVETQREHASTQLNTLKNQANELYGSDDVEQLKTMLEEMKAKNEAMRSEYQANLDGIDRDLLAINKKFSAPEGDPSQPPLEDQE